LPAAIFPRKPAYFGYWYRFLSIFHKIAASFYCIPPKLLKTANFSLQIVYDVVIMMAQGLETFSVALPETFPAPIKN
jgi:hypothetical protein